MSETTSMRLVPGFPFFPCRLCVADGFSGKNNDGCDHTAFERARAAGVNIHSTISEAHSEPHQEHRKANDA